MTADATDRTEARREHARLLARDCTRGVQHYAYNAADCPACSAALETWDAHGGTPTPTTPAAPSTPMPTVAITRSTAQRASTPAAPTTPEALLNAINAAPDDAARAKVLAAVPRELRAQFRALLAYRELAAADTAQDAFSRKLNTAADDAARLAIIARTDRAVLAEWRFWRRANDDTAPRHYLALANEGRETD